VRYFRNTLCRLFIGYATRLFAAIGEAADGPPAWEGCYVKKVRQANSAMPVYHIGEHSPRRVAQREPYARRR